MPSSNIEYGHEDCPGIVAKSYNGQAGISMLNAVVHFQETSEGWWTVGEFKQGSWSTSSLTNAGDTIKLVTAS